MDNANLEQAKRIAIGTTVKADREQAIMLALIAIGEELQKLNKQAFGYHALIEHHREHHEKEDPKCVGCGGNPGTCDCVPF